MSALKSIFHAIADNGAFLVCAIKSPAVSESAKRLFEVGMIAAVSSVIGTYAMTQRLEERIDGYAKIRQVQIIALEQRMLSCESSISKHLEEDLKERDNISQCQAWIRDRESRRGK